VTRGNSLLAVIWAAIVFCSSLLMVSTWRFYSFKDLDFRNRQPLRLVLVIATVFGLIWWQPEITLVVLAYGYMLSGIVMGMRFLFRGRRQRAQLTEASEVQ
jgi:CDP-diacylglycerol--serine O-phosphatidyltransferase